MKVFSFNNLYSARPIRTIKAFENLIFKRSLWYLPYLLIAYIGGIIGMRLLPVYVCYIIDKLHYKTIEDFNLGNINSRVFLSRLKKQMWLKANSKEIKNAWLIMFKLGKQDVVKLRKIFSSQEVKFIICMTNCLHYKYIKSQLRVFRLTKNLVKVKQWRSYEDSRFIDYRDFLVENRVRQNQIDLFTEGQLGECFLS